MLSFEPSVVSGDSIFRRRTAFSILVGIGGVLAGVLLLDAYVDWVHQGDPLWSTVLENSIPALLGLSLPFVGWRILRSTSEFPYLPEAARWALIGSLGMMLLSGLVLGVHVLQEEIKPLVIAVQLASVGAVAGLWVGYSLARVKEAEQRAKEDRGRLENLLDGLPAPVVHGRFEGDRLGILRANAAFAEVFGQEVEEAEGRDLYNIVVPEVKREEAAEIDRQAIEEGLVDREVRRLTSQGPRDFQLRVAQALDDGASETYAIYTDITEQKRRRRELERQNDLFEKAQEIANVGAWEYDLQAEELTLTDQAYRVHGLAPGSDMTPERSHELYHPEDRPAAQQAFRRALEEGESYDIEARLITEEGEERWVRTRGEPQSENGEVVRVRGAIQNITDRKQRERELRLSEQVIEQADDSILVTEAHPIDEPGPRIEYVNPAFEEMTGYSREEIEGKTPRVLQGPETDRTVLDSLRNALEEGESWSGETINYRKDGEPYHLRWSIAPVRNEDGEIEHWMSVQRDVTDEKERQEQLRRQRNLLGQTQRLAGAWEIDLHSGDVSATEKVYEIHELEPEAEVDAERILEFYPSEVRSKVQEAFQRCAEEGKRYDLEVPFITAKGNRRWIRTVGAPAEEEGREITKIAGAFQDITQRKENEQELLEAKKEAEEASRLKSAMLANMSHEIRTPLTSITGFSEMLTERLEGQLEVYATRIHKSSQRLQRTLESVLHLSKLEAGVDELDREELSLQELVEETLELFSSKAVEKSLTVTTDFADGSVVGHWNKDAIHRICQNLLENAVKFTPEGGEIYVRVHTEDQEAILEVEDTGIGMDPDNVPELFKAFKQESEGLDREYEGSGLGLSIVKRLINELGGDIEVDTEKGEGTCFTVRLPRENNETAEPEES